MYHIDDTIAAIASARGGAARGIVRLSGPGVMSILEDCFRSRSGAGLAEVRRASVVPGAILLDGSCISELPADLLLWPNRRSYTREPLAELHTIGSPPLLSAVMSTVCRGGARLAEPGEFTLRAFLAGRLDLLQAEAVLGVIDARGTADLNAALVQLAGGLTQPLDTLRRSLVELLAHIEAGLDFAEEDIQFIAPGEIQRQLDQAAALVAQLCSQLRDRGRNDDAPSAVLVGWPNVGKSSLFNALAAGAAAIVENQPGTTRDYLTAPLELGTVRCQLVDTAGVEPGNPADGRGDPVDETAATRIGLAAQRLAADQARNGDLRLLCFDATRPLNEAERNLLAADPSEPRLVLLTKCDGPRRAEVRCDAVETSAHTGQGLDQLREALRRAIGELRPGETSAQLTLQRCGESLSAAGKSLARAAGLNRASAGEELIGSELRVALAELGSVVGAVYTDDILDHIFSRFCIGK